MTTSFTLDTNIAIHLRDGEPGMAERVEALNAPVWLSMITRVELEGGVQREPEWAAARRSRLDALLSILPCHPFDDRDADIYRRIVERLGYSRRKLLDRMIAAQAIAREATLVTRNADDFRDIAGLQLLEW